MANDNVSAGNLCFFEINLASSLKEVEVWLYSDDDHNDNKQQQQHNNSSNKQLGISSNTTPASTPPLTRIDSTLSYDNSVISRGFSDTSSYLSSPTRRPRRRYNNNHNYDAQFEELADRFRQTQDALLCGSNHADNNNPDNHWRTVKKAELLRMAMIMTMLSSQDSQMAQAAQDALRDNAPLIVNPYQVLQVRRDATPQEIRSSYRRLALWHHPGRCCAATPEERHRRLHVFEILAAAYETLLDKECRARCDELLNEQKADQGRSKDLPAGMVNVGGRPLSPGSVASSKLDDAASADTFVARVIGRLAGSRIGSFDTQDDDNDNNDRKLTANGMPPVEPVSSDSSEEGVAKGNDEEDDDSFGPATSALASPRIHVPLGTPIGTPLRNQPLDDSMETELLQDGGCGPPACGGGGDSNRKSKKGFLIDTLNCGINTSASYDPIPPLINSSSSVVEQKGRDGEMHYTESETNRLFGGPLQLMYRARRWKSFRDPMDVFADVFGSKVALGSNPMSGAEQALSLPPRGSLLLPPPNSSAAWSGSSETLKDGTILFKTSRILHNRRMTRTEAVWTDPETGERHSKVTVTSEVLDEENGEESEEVLEEDQDGCFAFSSLCDGPMCECNRNEESVTAEQQGEGMLCGAACSWF